MPVEGYPVGVWVDDRFYVFGRVSIAQAPYCRDVAGVYDPMADTWSDLPGAPGPVGCFEGGDVAVWTGEEILLWGVTNTAFDPATERWRKLPRPPAGWGGPSVVAWTGSQMIGWGGGCCGSVDADGAAYTPSTDRWRLLPPAPIAGRHAMGAWTGTALLIVGGSGADTAQGTGVFADGAAYDPTTRTWRRLPRMPFPREGGEAFWTGEELVVLGGRTPTGRWMLAPAEEGVAYDPSTDTWRRLAPMVYPRIGFVGAWTGEILVVWGGTMPKDTLPKSGEIYDPATDSWSPLPRSPLRARQNALSGWTGDELLIFGGWDARKDRWRADGAALIPPSA
jgi:N-acetylneuraminic acid mutarotase